MPKKGVFPPQFIGKGFKPGQSGNPLGRPKGLLSITGEIKKKLMEIGPDGRRDYLTHLIENMMQDALDGKNNMDKVVWSYVDGLPRQQLNIDVELKPIPILGSLNVPTNNSNQQNLKAHQENSSSAGGDVSQQDYIDSTATDTSSPTG